MELNNGLIAKEKFNYIYRNSVEKIHYFSDEMIAGGRSVLD